MILTAGTILQYEAYFVKSHGWFVRQSTICIAMDFVPLGDLANYIENEGALKERDARDVIRQLLRGLKFMHDNQITHSDIKPDVSAIIPPPLFTVSSNLTCRTS
jgi:serine/threonine protein kinase